MNGSVYLVVTAILFAGCSQARHTRGSSEVCDQPIQYVSATPVSPAMAEPSSTFVADDRDGDAVLLDISLAPELEAVLHGGPDVSFDLIEAGQFAAWQTHAEIRLQLEIQRSKSAYLRELLRLAEESELDFLERFGVSDVGTSDTPGYRLRMFRLIRNRIEDALRATEASITQSEALLP